MEAAEDSKGGDIGGRSGDEKRQDGSSRDAFGKKDRQNERLRPTRFSQVLL